MKKIITALSLACIMLFVGCSCNQVEKLAFSNPWSTSDVTEKVGTTETATYDVKFSTNVSTSSDSYKYNQDSALKDKFNMNVTEGSYKTELKVLDKADAKLNDVKLDEAIKSNILNKILVTDPDNPANSDTALIYYKTTAILKGKYVVNKQEVKDFDDLIITESYFTRSDLSFAPIYSRTLVRTSVVNISGSKISFGERCDVSTIVYNQGKYYMSTFEDEKNDERATAYINAYTAETPDYDAISQIKPNKKSSHGYSFRTAIDNSELLFALRGFKFKKGSSKELSVVVKPYASPKKITAKCYATSKVDCTETLKDISVNCVAFGLSGQNTGRYKLAFIQNSSNESLSNNVNAIVKYIEPLTALGTYQCLGALEFTLTSLSTTIV